MIEMCIERKVQLPTLMLLYSGIDAVAWLGSASEERSVQRRFTSWVDQYLLPAKRLNCTAIDLYGAPCGILHTLTGDSDLGKAGKARPIGYAWGNAKASELQKWLDMPGAGQSVAVHIEELAEGFRLGMAQMFEDAETNAELKRRIEGRAPRFFVSIPHNPGEWPGRSAQGA